MTKLAVIIDSSCSLPDKLLNKYNIRRVPLSYQIDGQMAIDPCSEAQTIRLFESGELKRKHEVTTQPPSVDAFEKAIMQAVEEGNELIVVQTVNRKQGETYDRANTAAANVKHKLGERRDVAIRVMDSRTVWAGQGLMVAETIRRTLKGGDTAEVRRTMDKLSAKIHTFILPKEPLLALERSQKRNEKAVNWTQVFIANALNIHPTLCVVNDSSYLASKGFGFEKSAKRLFKHACNRIQKGLLSPLVTVNYAGRLEDLKKLPGYAELVETARVHKIQLIPSVKSIAGGIYTSVGSLSLAMVCEPHEWDD